MSFYNMLFGKNPMSSILLKMLDLTEASVGRFRDAYLNEDGTRIIILTRNGGGNRGHWEDDDAPEGPDCHCPGCVMEYDMPKHPNYITDYDDDFDRTYAYIEFSIPEKFKEFCNISAKEMPPQATFKEKFDRTIKEIKTMTPEEMRKDERFKQVIGMLDLISKKVEKKTN